MTAAVISSVFSIAAPLFPRWYFFAADLLLVALALVLIYKGPGPLNWKGKLFCTIAVALGGCLGLIAVCMKKRDGGKDEGRE